LAKTRKPHQPHPPRKPAAPIDKVGVIVVEAWHAIRNGRDLQSVLAELFKLHAAAARARQHVLATIRVLCRRHVAILRALKAAGKNSIDDEIFCTAARLLTGSMKTDAAEAQSPHVPWRQFLQAEERIRAKPDLVINGGWPEPLAAALLQQFGDEAYTLDEALAQEPPLALRCNTLRGSRQELLARLIRQKLPATASELSATGIVMTEHANVFALSEFTAGWFELQDEASQLVAELLAPAKPGLWIDYCAGAGGKTLAIAALLANRGQIVACDLSARRMQELLRRARRAGAENIQPVVLPKGDPGAAPEIQPYAGKASRVLVDAPCSGSGALRRKPDIRLRFKGDELTRFPQLQLDILNAAAVLCASGGRMVYATCSVLREENEGVVERFVAKGDFEVEPVASILPEPLAKRVATSDGRFMRCLPHIHGTDGFFTAALRKK